MTMEMVPASVGRAAQGWDEQHLDVGAAAGQVADAGSGGFTSAVAPTAARFLTTWNRHLDALATRSEAQADGLRVTMNDWVATDEGARDYFALLPYLTEVR